MLARAAARSSRARALSPSLASVARARRFTNNLDVKLPDLARDDLPLADGGAKVPFVFDFWESKAKNAAAAAKSVADELAASSLPKVMTAASPTTYPGGGPSSNAYEPAFDAEAETAEQAVEEAKGFWGGLAQDVGVPSAGALRQSLANITAEDPAPPPPATKNRELDEEDKKGLWILLGLVAGGWIAGGIFSPRKRKHAH